MNKQKKQVSKKDIKTPKKDAKPTETKKSPQPSKRSDDSQKETKKKVTKVVPQLSDLKGKVLASYMAELNKDLY